MTKPEMAEAGPSILGDTLKVVGAVGFVAVAAATWLSAASLDGSGQTRIASAQSRGSDEPSTTGSIVRAADLTRLDPCSMPGGRIVASPRAN